MQPNVKLGKPDDGELADQDPVTTASFSNSKLLTFLDFFAGAGLVRLGLEPRWSCSWANDIDPKKQSVYQAHFGKREFVRSDIADITTDSVPVGADMAWASFPCQDLSLAGWRKGMRAARSGTYWEFWRLMRDSSERGERPPLIVIENVVGMLYGSNFRVLCDSLAAIGMQFGALVVDARYFLPQSRPRVFVVAVDSRVDCSPLVSEEPDASVPWFSKAIRSAHARLPDALKEWWRWWKLPQPTSVVQPVDEVIEEVPVGVQWHEPEETSRLLAMMTDVNLRKIRLAKERNQSVGFLYKRMRRGIQRAEVRFDGVAGCLRTPQGGSSRQTVLLLDNDRIMSRLLSPREAARLMGVPDSFHLPTKYNDAYRAIGDGVAVPVVRWLSDQLLVNLTCLCRLSDVVKHGNCQGSIGQRRPSSTSFDHSVSSNRSAVAT